MDVGQRVGGSIGSTGWAIIGTLVGCAPAASQPDAGSSGDESTTTNGDDPSTASGNDGMTTEDPSVDTTDDPSGETSGPAECGNGIVEVGEDCDDDGAGCSECAYVCGLGEGMLLPASSATLGGMITPVPIPDAAGEVLFGDYGAIYRSSAEGSQVWAAYGDANDYTRNVAVIDGFAWSGWRLDHTGDVHAAIKLHDLASGDVIESIEVSDAEESWDAYVHAAPDGTLLVSILETSGVDEYRTELQGRSPDGGDLLWSVTPDLPDGDTSLSQIHIAADADGFFTSGSGWGDDRHAVVMRFDLAGAHQWTWLDETTATLQGSAYTALPAPTPDGGVVVVASLRGSGTQPSVGNLLSYDTRVVRLDARGAVTLDLPTNDLAGEGRVQLEGVEALADGRILAVGSLLVAGHGDAWLGYLDAEGGLLCQQATPDPGGIESSISDVYLGSEGELYVHGYADEESLGENSTVRQWVSMLRPY